MRRPSTLLATAAAASVLVGLGVPARAAGGSDATAFMKAANTNGDATLSVDEIVAYAKKRFAQIESDGDKTLDQKELKDRLSEAGLATADTDKDKTVDEAEFVAYAKTLFEQADTHKEAAHPTLGKQELETAAGQKLIALLH